MGNLEWLVMARAPGVGRVRLVGLMNAYPDPADVWQLSVGELASLEHWNRSAAAALLATRRNPSLRAAAINEWEQATHTGLRQVALPELDYPVRLRETPDPPPYFYQAGPWVPDARPVIAIVGTRKPTAYGLSVAERFGRQLATAGAVIVSGMARGIDSAAHRGALQVGGTTLAILGGGADVCYPRESKALYQEIRRTGAVISEQAPGAEPRREFFPERNRIISGLADGLIVVEAGAKSGTLITVASALAQGRDVFAIPGAISNPMASGPHEMIREGACLVTEPEQVLEALGYRTRSSDRAAQAASERLIGLSAEAVRIAGWMGLDPHWATELVETCGIPAHQVQAALSILELKGIVRQLPNGQYVRVS